MKRAAPLLASLLVGLAISPAGATTITAAGGWHQVGSANVGPTVSFTGIFAASHADLWALGGVPKQQAFVSHRDGESWSDMPAPGAVQLREADGLSTDFYAIGGDTKSSVVDHWNGSSWSFGDSTTGTLNGVARIANGEAWAAGTRTGLPQSLHWDGTSWTSPTVPTPNSADGGLNDVSGASPGDVWGVGFYRTESTQHKQTLLVRWGGSSWSTWTTPNLTRANGLNAVSMDSPTDGWAVGFFANKALVEHWDGTTWSRVAAPGTPLQDVVAFSSTDAWASGGDHLLHWDGSTWSSTAAPGIGKLSAAGPNDIWSGFQHFDGSSWSQLAPPVAGVDNMLTGSDDPGELAVGTYRDLFGRNHPLIERGGGVADVQDTPGDGFLQDVSGKWAVGYWIDSSGDHHTLIEQFHAHAWKTRPVDLPGNLFGVVTWGDEAWAVGNTVDSAGQHPLIMHWVLGVGWTEFNGPDLPGNTLLLSVAQSSPSDVWAAGFTTVAGTRKTLTEHWNGSSWAVVPSPNVGSSANVLNGISVWTVGGAWAVGHDRSGNVLQTLVEHWDGSSWTVVPSPNPGQGSNDLFSVAISTLHPDEVWAVGSSSLGSVTQPLIEYWNGHGWSPAYGPAFIGDSELRAVSFAGGGPIAFGSTLPPNSPLQTLAESMTVSANVFDDGFLPRVIDSDQGITVFWRIDPQDTQSHVIEDGTGLGLFVSPSLSPGQLYGATFVGSGTYGVIDPTDSARTTVRVPVRAPSSGAVGQALDIQWASAAASGSFVYDVQVQLPSQGWTAWQSGTNAASGSYTPATAGAYSFRARVRDSVGGARSGWSPAATVNVS